MKSYFQDGGNGVIGLHLIMHWIIGLTGYIGPLTPNLP